MSAGQRSASRVESLRMAVCAAETSRGNRQRLSAAGDRDAG